MMDNLRGYSLLTFMCWGWRMSSEGVTLAWSKGRGMESLSTVEERCFIIDRMHGSIIIILSYLGSRGA